mmetsp:Transcript_573/g.1345  ORF Transcript_573/g.1345 Transcript_573/m.1345 type:complete len:207 (-) Transcript_573:2652-3272(-)
MVPSVGNWTRMRTVTTTQQEELEERRGTRIMIRWPHLTTKTRRWIPPQPPSPRKKRRQNGGSTRQSLPRYHRRDSRYGIWTMPPLMPTVRRWNGLRRWKFPWEIPPAFCGAVRALEMPGGTLAGFWTCTWIPSEPKRMLPVTAAAVGIGSVHRRRPCRLLVGRIPSVPGMELRAAAAAAAPPGMEGLPLRNRGLRTVLPSSLCPTP